MKESGLSGPSSWMHHIATVCRYCGVVVIVWGGGGGRGVTHPRHWYCLLPIWCHEYNFFNKLSTKFFRKLGLFVVECIVRCMI